MKEDALLSIMLFYLPFKLNEICLHSSILHNPYSNLFLTILHGESERERRGRQNIEYMATLNNKACYK